jgi:dihydrodiol dehydrogenase / D-xylose 1-dehydrogenase (NADP)
VDSVDPMAAEADAISLALAEGRAEVPEMTWAETISIAAALADWRRGLV